MPRTAAMVGVTGAVGQEFASVLRDRRFPVSEWRLFASPRSAGREIDWLGTPTPVLPLTPAGFEGVDVAFFSAGASVSREYALLAARSGAVVIDNSSAFRLDPDVPLVVPEVNAEAIRAHDGIIANPNCSTIILAVVLWPLHQRWGVRRVVVSTYQAVSGAGARAMEELRSQTRAVLAGEAPRAACFPQPCAFNVFSHDSPVGTDGLNGEERKMVAETRKIFATPELAIAPTCMRVPVLRAHTEALTVEFEQPVEPDEARRVLDSSPGLCVVDDPQAQAFPTPLAASGRDEVLVGRVRSDASIPDRRGLQLLCAGDQLRKGAALNAVQIAERL